MAAIREIRPSPIAGMWYSADAQSLAAEIDGYLDKAVLPAWEGEVIAVIAPHAGYRYSGPTAGYAFRSVMGQSPDLVAVVSPLHAYHAAEVLTTRHKAYATPLGTIPVDRAALQQLTDALAREGSSPFALASLANDTEHALEIELPFLQRALAAPFSLLPLMVRSLSAAVLLRLGQALAEVARSRNALLVASTDLSHFYPENTAAALDREMLAQIESFSPEGVLDAEQRGLGFACGAGAVAAVLWAAKFMGADTVKVLHHSTSAKETGDRRSVVGYGAAVVIKHT